MTMNIQLRDYQKAASDKAVAFFNDKKAKYNAIMVLPTGSGKSIVLADIANRLDDNILIFCPSREILKQNYEKMGMINPFGCAIFSASFNSKDVGKVTFATIGSVKSHPELFQHFKYIMVDEAHQCNPKQGMYKEFFEVLGQTKVLGLTATPYRLSSYMGGSMLKFITRTRPNIFSKVIYQVQISTLLDMGYLSKISYYQLSPTGWNESRLKVNTTGADYTDKSVIMEYQRVDFYGFLVSIVERLLNPKRGGARKGILVFTRFVKEANQLADKIPDCAVVSAETPKAERDTILQKFKAGEIKVVANAGVLTTGFDYPELDTVVMARPTMSLALYYQMCLDMETEILTKRGFLKYGEVRKSDEVAAYHKGSIIFCPIRSIVHRKTYEGEKFVSFSNQHIDFRITGEHDLLVRAKGATCDFMKEFAEKTMERKSSIEVPVSAVENTQGLPLDDDEIRFIGWCISDGSINKSNNAIHIVQSKTKPCNLEEIEHILSKCKLRYSKILAKRKGKFAKYAETYHFVISKGMPRKKTDIIAGLTGWDKYEKYLCGCKQWNEEYEKMTEHQFDVFIKTINKADGANRHTIDYNSHTFSISCGTFKDYANKLQSLAVRRGYRCNLFEFIANNGNTQYLLHIKKVAYSLIAGSREKDGVINKSPYKRSRMKQEVANDEYVWCVKDDYGTLVTRRNGKVLIMGNCGRCIRPHKGKDAWFVDLCGNIKRFGKVEDLKLVDTNNKGKWAVFSNGRQLTNVMFE